MGALFGMDPPHISLAAERLGSIGPLIITNSLVMMLLVMVVLVGFFARVAGRAALLPTGRAQMLGETIVEGLLGLVEGVAGKSLGRRIFPLIATLFIFILLANWVALLPGVGTIGRCEALHAAEAQVEEPRANTCPKGTEFVPLLRAANADLNMTVAMALVAIFIVQFTAVRFHGVGGYLKELATPWFLFPVHVVSELSRILSLSARLFGNIFGGEVFLVVIFFLFPLLIPLIPLGLELFFGFIQAVLFSVLTLVYVSIAAAGHGGHGEEHGEAHGHEATAAH